MQQESMAGLRVKLCDFVDYIDEVLIKTDLLSTDEQARFTIWASISSARLSRKRYTLYSAPM